MDQTSTSAGGSNAQDFQPLTQNPQSNVDGSLQPNGASPSSLFQQPDANQQAFPTTNSLRVLSSGTKNTTSEPAPDIPAEGMGWGFLPLVLIVALIVPGVLLLRRRKPQPVVQIEVPAQTAPIESANKKPKKKPKKKSRRKKK